MGLGGEIYIKKALWVFVTYSEGRVVIGDVVVSGLFGVKIAQSWIICRVVVGVFLTSAVSSRDPSPSAS